MKDWKFNHAEFTAACILLNTPNSNMSVWEYDAYRLMFENAINKLTWIAEQKGCMSCKFFEGEIGKVRGCMKADMKMPPDNVQKVGCEQYENKHEIPW